LDDPDQSEQIDPTNLIFVPFFYQSNVAKQQLLNNLLFVSSLSVYFTHLVKILRKCPACKSFSFHNVGVACHVTGVPD